MPLEPAHMVEAVEPQELQQPRVVLETFRPRNLDDYVGQMARVGCNIMPGAGVPATRPTKIAAPSGPPPSLPQPFQVPSRYGRIPRLPPPGSFQEILARISTIRFKNVPFKKKPDLSENQTSSLLWSNHALWQDAVFDLPLGTDVDLFRGLHVGVIGPSELREYGFQDIDESGTFLDWACWGPLTTTFVEWTPSMSLHSPLETARELQAAIDVSTYIVYLYMYIFNSLSVMF
jgi:hypothetical protein